MSQHKVSSEFIKQAHKAACIEWKRKLEKQFPTLFKYPKTMIVDGDSQHEGTILLFTAESVGTVIKPGPKSDYKVGHSFGNWNMSYFKDYIIK